MAGESIVLIPDGALRACSGGWSVNGRHILEHGEVQQMLPGCGVHMGCCMGLFSTITPTGTFIKEKIQTTGRDPV